MNVPPIQISRSLAPTLVGYSVLGRCWEDAISITFKGVAIANDDPVLIRMTKGRRAQTARASPLRKDYEFCGKYAKATLTPLHYSNIDGVEYLVLPNIGIQPLAEILLQRQLSLAESLTLLVKIVSGIEELHQDEVVHCSINPHSLWANDELLDVRITDFSLAVFRDETPPLHQLHTDLQYVAPEQTGRMNRLLDARVDLYSIGAVAYFLLCGRPPFDGAAPLELIHAHLAQIPVFPKAINSQLPHVVSRIVMKLLSKAPEERYQTAAGLKSDLEQCLTQWQRHGRIHDFSIGEADSSSTFKVSTKLYGRDTELSTLRPSWREQRSAALNSYLSPDLPE